MVTPLRRWLFPFLLLCLMLGLTYSLRQILFPFAVAAVTAYALDPWVLRLETMGIKRHWAALAVMLIGSLCILAILFLIIPVFIKQYTLVASNLPDIWLYLKKQWISHPRLKSYLPSLDGLDFSVLKKAGQWLLPWLKDQAQFLGVIALFPFLLYFFLLTWDRSIVTAKELIPPRYREKVGHFFRDMDDNLAAYVRGQLIVMVLMAVFYGTGLWLVGVPSGFAIGAVTGLLVFVPYLGFALGLLMALLTMLLSAPWTEALWRVLPVFLLGQAVESFWFTPKYVGERIGLSPIAVLFALMAFGHWFGPAGVFFALPLAAISDVVIRYVVRAYRRSPFYLDRSGSDPSHT